MAMKITLIVCTVGRTDHLRRLLSSLRSSASDIHEILIVDQNPAGFLDGVLAEAPSLPLKRIISERGLSRARNIGLSAASGDIIGFPDDDCWYPPDVVGRVKTTFASQPQLRILTGRTTDQEGVTSVSPHMDLPTQITRENVFKAGNSNGIFVLTEVARSVGGFDEKLGVGSGTSFQSGEETDFMLRALARGAIGYFDPTLIVHHEQGDPRSARQIDRVKMYSAGFGRVLRKNRFGWRSVLNPVARTLVRSVLCAIKFDRAGAAQRFAWAAGAVSGFRAKT